MTGTFFETLAEGEILKCEIYERHKALVNAADSWADAGTPRSSAREGLKSSYGVGIVNLILSINITCRYRNFYPATIVVSIERENEFKQHARTSRAGTRERTGQDDEEDDAKNLYQHKCLELQKQLMLRRAT